MNRTTKLKWQKLWISHEISLTTNNQFSGLHLVDWSNYNIYVFATKNVVDNYQRKTAKTIATTTVSEAKSKEKHVVWGPMPVLTITSPYVHSRVDSNIFTMGNPMSEPTLTLCQRRLYSPVRDFGFSLWGLKGTQAWEIFWLRFWILYYFIVN